MPGIKNVPIDSLKKHLEIYFIAGYTENIETTNRYIREMRTRDPEWLEFMQSTSGIREKFTAEEIKQLSKGERKEPARKKRISFDGDVFRFSHITDTHMGSIFFKEYIWDALVSEINSQDLDAVFHSGDITDGLNTTRTDSYYELTHIGYAQQKAYAVEKLSELIPPVYLVDGNHDRFFKKSAGACIGDDIAHEIDNVYYLGEDMADFHINGISIRLWHGEDASSYASSYRLQKLIESFTGGDKPNVLLCGHTHKMVHMFERHIHCLSGGAVTTQSNWMKRKRLANHTGFWIVEMTFDDRGVNKFSPTWYPFYE